MNSHLAPGFVGGERNGNKTIMGMHTDWFIANESDASAIAKSKNPWKRWPSLTLKGILEIELASLYGFLLGKRKFDADLSTTGEQLYYDGADYDEEGNPIGSSGSGTIIVHRVATDLIKRLAKLGADDEIKIAAKWAEIEEFADWSKAEKKQISAILKQMIEFAQSAIKAKKPVLELAVF